MCLSNPGLFAPPCSVIVFMAFDLVRALQGYGMTEAGPVLAQTLSMCKTPYPVKPGSCGTVVRNAEVKIIDIETGMSLPYNQCGEICIRGPQIMKGEFDHSS